MICVTTWLDNLRCRVMDNLGLLLAEQDPAVIRRWFEQVAPASLAAPEFGGPGKP